MSELLKVEKLSAGYGEAVVLNDISFALGEGQTLALLGRNGTGKTTLINTLAGATRQHAGTIALGATALHKLASYQRGLQQGSLVHGDLLCGRGQQCTSPSAGASVRILCAHGAGAKPGVCTTSYVALR